MNGAQKRDVRTAPDLEPAEMRNADIALCRRWAEFYRARGLNPLPSRVDAKRPLVRYAGYWEAPAPAGLFERYPTTNVQVMTGVRWGLVVLDLDGPEARDWLAGHARSLPRTWLTHSGGEGRHYWFRLPAGFRGPLPKAVLWGGVGGHSAAERLGDHCLVVAPPSIHPETGRRYRFASVGESPQGLALPAECPGWLLATPAAEMPRPVPIRRPVSGAGRGRYRASDVIEAIPDVIGLVRGWGVRFAGRRSPAGWWPCHAIDRDDRHPSAAVHERSGRYVDLGSGRRLGLFDLAAALGAAGDWREALVTLGERFHARAAS